MVETYLAKFEDAKISIQITLDIGKPVTVHAFDHNGKLHKTESEWLFDALEKMEEKLID